MASDERHTRTTQPALTLEDAPPSVERVRLPSAPAPARPQSSRPPPDGRAPLAVATEKRGASVPPASRQARSAGDTAEPLLAVLRLLKNARIHRIDNAAVLLAAEQASTALRDFAQLSGGSARLTFVGDLVFVGGELLRAGRAVYASARELGSLLHAVGANEVTFAAGVAGQDLVQFADRFNTALRTPGYQLDQWQHPRISVRLVSELAYLPLGSADQEPAARVLELYGISIAVMRAFYADVAAGNSLLPRRVKRLAQRWVMSALSGEDAFLHLTTLAPAHRDVAGRVVHSALLVLALARVLTRDRRILGELALAALLAEVGRVRAAGSVVTQGSDSAELMSLEASSAVMIAAGGWEPSGWLRTGLVFEVAWLERPEQFGPLYGGQAQGLLGSRLLQVVRAYLERVAPAAGGPGLAPPEALADLVLTSAVHSGLVRLLARALGVLPTGTVVELVGGEWAIVSAPKATAAYHRPALRVVTDGAGNPQPVPIEVDLEQTSVSGIRRLVTNEQARFNLAQAFFGAVEEG